MVSPSEEPRPDGRGAAVSDMHDKLRFLVFLLAAGVVLAGPFIRDNGLRGVWVTLGLAVSLFCYRALFRARSRP